MTREAEKRRCLHFSGEDDFAYWSEKFESYMHTKKLRGQLLGTDTSNDDEKYNIWAALVQCLDKRSIKMLKSECKGNGPEAWKRLTAHIKVGNDAIFHSVGIFNKNTDSQTAMAQ